MGGRATGEKGDQLEHAHGDGGRLNHRSQGHRDQDVSFGLPWHRARASKARRTWWS